MDPYMNMSTPASQASSRAHLQEPSTPEQSRPPMTRSASLSVAPKSEYLRNALQARRAHGPPPSFPFDPRPLPPTPLKLTEIKTPKTSSDIFDEFALTEEQTTPVSPIHRRRPSDVGLPRPKTNRELTNEIERLKDHLMTSNMRVELLKKNNSQLQHDLTKARERVEELEPLEQENHELRNEKDCLRLKVEDMEEENEQLRDANDTMQKTNEELAAIADESASHWQDQEYAIDEAAECIIKLEEEKSGLAAELQRLKERVTVLEDTSHSNTLVNGSPGRYPMRMYSLDESRPSTSHFDSDYYSQPTSPHIKPSRESILSITPSERSRKFLDLSDERRRSARDLVRRISVASLKALSIRPSCPVPEVPQIPMVFQQQTVCVFEEGTPKTVARTPVRYRRGQELVSPSLLEAAQISPVRSEAGTPLPSSHPSEGLRGRYHPDRTVSRKPSNESCPSSIQVASLTNSTTPITRQFLTLEASPCVSSHSSSRYTHTNSSHEQLQGRNPRHRRQSESDMNFDGTPKPVIELGSFEWASLAPPPSVSVVSEVTTEVDPREDKDRWWRNMDRLTLPQVMAQSQLATKQAIHSPPQIVSDNFSPTKQDEVHTTIRPSRSGDKIKKIASPMMPSSPYKERDFFFNGAEDEDMFIRKATAWIGGGRR